MARRRTPLPRRAHHGLALRGSHRAARHQGGHACQNRVLTPPQPDTQTFTRTGVTPREGARPERRRIALRGPDLCTTRTINDRPRKASGSDRRRDLLDSKQGRKPRRHALGASVRDRHVATGLAICRVTARHNNSMPDTKVENRKGGDCLIRPASVPELVRSAELLLGGATRRRGRFIAVSSGLVSLFVGLVSAPSAVATTVATSAPPIPVTVTAAGISLAYPSGWTSIELTPHGFTDQVQRLAKTDPVKASILKSRGANPRLARSSTPSISTRPRGASCPTRYASISSRRSGRSGWTARPQSSPRAISASVRSASGSRDASRSTAYRHSVANSHSRRLPKRSCRPCGFRSSSSHRRVGPGCWSRLPPRTAPPVQRSVPPCSEAFTSSGVRVPGPGPLQLRPVLAALPPATSTVSASGAASAAIASCDVNQIAALPEVPTTDSSPDTCVVLPFKSRDVKGHLYLGPVRLTTADSTAPPVASRAARVTSST